MRFLSAILLTVLAVATNVSSKNVEMINHILDAFSEGKTKDLFKVYHHLYEKKYDLNTQEGLKRYKIFKDTLKYIKQVNSEQDSYQLGITQFTDLTNEEYREKYLLKPEQMKKRSILNFLEQNPEKNFGTINFDDYADNDEAGVLGASFPSYDWSMYFVNPRNQEQCGCCWAFSTAGAIEGNYNKNKNLTFGNQLTLSPQQLVDCDTTNSGCNGGNANIAMQYINQNGLVCDNVYKFNNTENKCTAPTNTNRMFVSGYSYCDDYSGDDEVIKACSDSVYYGMLAQGPFSVYIDGSSAKIQNYRNGVLNLTAADCTESDHAIIAVGSGTDKNGNNFIKVRNSWDITWGERGYARLLVNSFVNSAKQTIKTCFVGNQGFLPTIVTVKTNLNFSC